MATRSTIGVLQSNGSVRSVYCHWDGYLNGVGAVLKKHYTTLEQANALVAGGDMSSLGHDEESTGFFSKRGENAPARDHKDLEGYRGYIEHSYNYLFEEGAWKWSSDGAVGSWKKV